MYSAVLLPFRNPVRPSVRVVEKAKNSANMVLELQAGDVQPSKPSNLHNLMQACSCQAVQQIESLPLMLTLLSGH